MWWWGRFWFFPAASFFFLWLAFSSWGGLGGGGVRVCSAALVLLLQLFSVGLAAMIPLGAGAERWKLGASCASTILLAGWIYPLFAHWVWCDGWLSQLGTQFGLGQGFVDGGGASTIQVMGGLSALSTAWMLGPRRGKYSSEAGSGAIPAHNIVLVLAGCMLAWVGWLGLDSAGAILVNRRGPSAVGFI